MTAAWFGIPAETAQGYIRSILINLQLIINHFFFSFTGVTVTLSTLIDVKNFNAGGHKVGMALELEA